MTGKLRTLYIICFAMAVSFSARAYGSAFVSDDFSASNLDTTVWTLVDPMADSSVSQSGGEVSIAVAGGTSHDVWTGGNMAPRIMQPAQDIDFELEAKFSSVPAHKYQLQGVLIQQNASNFIRFDFYSAGAGVRVFAAVFSNGSPSVRRDISVLVGNGPGFLRVSRTGDSWTLRWSTDGTNWNTVTSFNHALAVSEVGLFAGNVGSPAPAFVGVADYFFDNSAPIVPEDGDVGGPDTTGPAILNPSVVAISDTEARVSWTTDEPAAGSVEYGLTTLYELGAVSDVEFKSSHQFIIDGLQPENTYQFRLAGTDASGNTTLSENYSVEMSALPVIDVWYGDTQSFGEVGQPQWGINILGNASDPDGIAEMAYSLNGQSPQPLTVGPNGNRLEAAGDFNIEINYLDLGVGSNSITITATDNAGLQSQKTVSVDHPGQRVWPESYVADWSAADKISDVAQVVDGKWRLEGDSVRPDELGYDRLIAIGDVTWDEYEVTVPLTIHGFDPLCSQVYCAGGGPLVGVLARWPGHYYWGTLPNTGWYPMGALAVFSWRPEHTGLEFFAGSNGKPDAQQRRSSPAFDVPHVFKLKAETTSGSQRYSAKLWRESDPEPLAWDIVLDEPLSATSEGSLLLVAHHIDASFGQVVVTPLGGPAPADTTAPEISDIQVSVTESTATVTWQTNEQASSSVSYGQTLAYEDGTESNLALATSHSIALTDLQPGTQYFYRIDSVDASGNAASNASLVFTTDASPPMDATPPVIGNVQVSAVTATSATITWQTDELADSAVAFGTTSLYGEGTVLDDSLATSHSVMLGNLAADTQYYFEVRSTDGSGNESSIGGFTFRTDSVTSPPVGEIFDEFDGVLDTTIWTINDPVGDSSVSTTGSQLAISVPAGSSHDLWRNANDAPRVVRNVSDADFEVTVKFDSAVTQKYQLQGILMEQDNGNLVRFDFYSNGKSTRLFAASFSNGAPNVRTDFAIAGGAPLYMRVKREGNLWTQSYSYDGVNWLPGAAFSHSLNVATAGVFAGNAGGSPPAHTALVDFFSISE